MSSTPPDRPIPVLDLVGAITLDPDFRMEDVLRALDSMSAPELEELAQLLDQHEAAVRRATWRAALDSGRPPATPTSPLPRRARG